MATTLSIETPESVRFDYELADVGARALALGTDLLLQYLTIGLIFLGGLWLAPDLPDWSVGVWILLVFGVHWFYFVLFEAAWSGHTPGKRLVGIRVMRTGGYPVTWVSVLVRNLVRVVDSLPATYGVALAVAFWEPEHRRLGDLLAGTVVVRERNGRSTWLEGVPPPPAPLAASSWADAVLTLDVDEATRELVFDYLARRHSLEPDARIRVRAEILETVLDRVRSPADRVALLTRLTPDRQEAFLDSVGAARAPATAEPSWTRSAS